MFDSQTETREDCGKPQPCTTASAEIVDHRVSASEEHSRQRNVDARGDCKLHDHARCEERKQRNHTYTTRNKPAAKRIEQNRGSDCQEQTE